MRRPQVNGGSRATLGTEAICEMLSIVGRLRRPRATDFDNYRRANPELAQRLMADCKARYPLGTFERSREILQIIANSSPTKELTSAYFENMRASWNPGRGGPYPERSYWARALGDVVLRASLLFWGRSKTVALPTKIRLWFIGLPSQNNWSSTSGASSFSLTIFSLHSMPRIGG